MNNMGDALLKAGLFSEEDAEKVRRVQAIEAFWENPSPEHLRQLDHLVPESLRAAVPVESSSRGRHGDATYVHMQRLDLTSRLYDIWRDAMRSNRIMWTDESGNVHEKRLTPEDDGKTLAEIVDCDAAHVLTIQKVAYEDGPRHNKRLVQNYDVGLFLA